MLTNRKFLPANETSSSLLDSSLSFEYRFLDGVFGDAVMALSVKLEVLLLFDFDAEGESNVSSAY